MEVVMANAPSFIEGHLRSKMIDDTLMVEPNEKDFKLLLLGPANSGKSTVFKQMKIIHSQGFGLEERMRFRPVVYRNAVDSLAIIIRAMKPLHIKSNENAELIEEFLSIIRVLPEGELTLPLADMMSTLWADDHVRKCYRRAREYQLPDCAEYFLDDLERIKQVDYVPTEQDVLHTRVKTSGIVEFKACCRDSSTCLQFFFSICHAFEWVEPVLFGHTIYPFFGNLLIYNTIPHDVSTISIDQLRQQTSRSLRTKVYPFV